MTVEERQQWGNSLRLAYRASMLHCKSGVHRRPLQPPRVLLCRSPGLRHPYRVSPPPLEVPAAIIHSTYMFFAPQHSRSNTEYPLPMLIMYLTWASQLLVSVPLVMTAPLHNITIAVPDQTIYNTDPNELCLPAAWTDILIFFSANYLAHAATVRSDPGTSFEDNLFAAIVCLFFPAWGLSRAIIHTLTFSILAGDNLTTAARAGALCVVVRSLTWRPADKESLENAILSEVIQVPEGSSTGYTSSLCPVYKLTLTA
jgi:hypothetical protein